jgi:hypothetical protein
MKKKESLMTPLSRGQPFSKFWSQFEYVKFHRDIDSLLQGLIVSSVDVISESEVKYTFIPQTFAWPKWESIFSLRVVSLHYVHPGYFCLILVIDDAIVEFDHPRVFVGDFVNHCVFTRRRTQVPKSKYTAIEFIKQIKPKAMDTSWIKSTENVMIEIESLNFTTGAYVILVYLLDEVFPMKCVDITVKKLIITQKDIRLLGSVQCLRMEEVVILFFDGGVEMLTSRANKYYFTDLPSLTFEEATFPVGSIPKGIFRSVPEMFRKSDISITNWRCRLDVHDNYAFVFDRYYLVDITLSNTAVNVLPELFPMKSDEYTCKTSLGRVTVRIEWGVFAPMLVVSELEWNLSITAQYLTKDLERETKKPGVQPVLEYKFVSLYNSWVIYYKGLPTDSRLLLGQPRSSWLLKHVLEKHFKYEFTRFKAKKVYELEFASIDLKFGHFELHEHWIHGKDTHLVVFDYRSDWRGGVLEWKLADIDGNDTNELNRVVLFVADYRSVFMNVLETRCNKAYNVTFDFL